MLKIINNFFLQNSLTLDIYIYITFKKNNKTILYFV